MSEPTLDEDLVPIAPCSKKWCPSNEQLKKYPMLDEDIFDAVDEKLFYCKKCRERQKALDNVFD